MGFLSYMDCKKLFKLFMDTQNIPFRIVEPRGFLGAQHANMVHGFESRDVVVVEDHAVFLELRDGFHNILDLEAERRVVGFRGRAAREQRDERAAAGVNELSIR